MTAPLIAWAAVAPDGTLRPRSVRAWAGVSPNGWIAKETVRRRIGEAMAEVTKQFPSYAAYADAYRAGWRVVRVRIEVVEEVE